MKKILISTFLVLTIVLSTASKMFAISYEEAKGQDKPIVVMFHMHGCSACRRFSSKFDKFASKFSNKFIFVKEDVNSSKIADTLGSQFQTVPAFFIIEPKTQNAKRISDDCAWDSVCFTKTLQEYK